MDAKSLLESMLADGKVMAEKALSQAQDKIGVSGEGAERDATVDGMKTGALAMGALALLLGTNAGRKVTGAALKVGSVAAIGGLAYVGYQKWQDGQAGSPAVAPGEPVSQLSGDEQQKRSIALIRTMIAAAKADGHITDRERSLIGDQIDKQQFGAAESDFLQAELERDVDIEELASLADSGTGGAEMYLASRLVMDRANAAEKAWLDKFATALNLPDGLRERVEEQIA